MEAGSAPCSGEVGKAGACYGCMGKFREGPIPWLFVRSIGCPRIQ